MAGDSETLTPKPKSERTWSVNIGDTHKRKLGEIQTFIMRRDGYKFSEREIVQHALHELHKKLMPPVEASADPAPEPTLGD